MAQIRDDLNIPSDYGINSIIQDFEGSLEVLKSLIDVYKNYLALFKINELNIITNNIRLNIEKIATFIQIKPFIQIKDILDHNEKLHKDLENFVSEKTLPLLEDELRFQVDVKNTIFNDIKNSSLDFNNYCFRLKEKIKNSKNNRAEDDLELRNSIGNFEIRRKIQHKIFKSSIKIFYNLEERKLDLISDFGDFIDILIKSFKGKKEFINDKKIIEVESTKKYLNEKKAYIINLKEKWKLSYKEPDKIYYIDPIVGRLPYLIYGLSLFNISKIYGNPVTDFIMRLTFLIEESLLRLPIKYDSNYDSRIAQAHIREYERQGPEYKWDDIDPTIAPAILKEYLFGLPNSLIPKECYKKLEEISKIRNEETFLENLHELLNSIPIDHLKLLKFIILHLGKLLNCKNSNYTVVTLSMQVPSLFFQEEGNKKFAQTITFHLLKSHKKLFNN